VRMMSRSSLASLVCARVLVWVVDGRRLQGPVYRLPGNRQSSVAWQGGARAGRGTAAHPALAGTSSRPPAKDTLQSDMPPVVNSESDEDTVSADETASDEEPAATGVSQGLARATAMRAPMDHAGASHTFPRGWMPMDRARSRVRAGTRLGKRVKKAAATGARRTALITGAAVMAPLLLAASPSLATEGGKRFFKMCRYGAKVVWHNGDPDASD